MNISTLQLGHTDQQFPKRPSGKLDEYFYEQASVLISERWNSFTFNRDEDRENELINLLKIDDSYPYIFLHEDKQRRFVINRKYIEAGTRVIEPNPNWPFTIFDYAKVISGAKEIHCIESSFSVFIDSFDFAHQELYAHRYARPEVLNDGRHEFGYKKRWKLIY
jgi:hypothetical protein